MGVTGQGTSPKGPKQATSQERWDAFISHTSTDDDLATRLEQGLQKTGLNIWVDHSDLRRKGLLLSALQEALLRCAYLVLLWSQAAAQSRYVAAEWNFAWNREIPILPCCLDQALLPLGLAGYLYCDFRVRFDKGFSQLKEALQEITPDDKAVKEAQTSKIKFHHCCVFNKELVSKYKHFPDYRKIVLELFPVQQALMTALEQGRLDAAAHQQAILDPLVEAAVRAYSDDAYLLRTAGFNKEIAYFIKYWPQVQASQSPPDPLLTAAEERYWETLRIWPSDSVALSGLGRVLKLQGDLDAAKFFTKCGSEGE